MQIIKFDGLTHELQAVRISAQQADEHEHNSNRYEACHNKLLCSLQ